MEEAFTPLELGVSGFFTGYYEPVIAASRTPTDCYSVPLLRRPNDLTRTLPRSDLPGDGTWARRAADGRLVPYYDRAAIRAGALAGQGLELAYVADPADAFFAQVQGSARLTFADGVTLRIGYHGKTGHPYTAIGRVLIDRGALREGGATMQTIRQWLADHPHAVDEVLNANRSYVFFREKPDAGAHLGPVAGGGVPLVPWRSLAVDRRHWRDGTPAVVETELPDGTPFTSVMIAEDTGTAIVGPARGDIFMGSGSAAGTIAGGMKAAGRIVKFLPKHIYKAWLG